MMIERIRGNLLDAEAEALVNTVNTQGVMGKGIALQFKNAFPENYRAYKKACDGGRVVPGNMFIFDQGGLQQPRYIINFPTKRHWRAKSRIEDIQSGLAALVNDVIRLNIRSIALPPLGCGNGGLNWLEVFPLIQKAFAPLENIRVLIYEPKGPPAAEKMRNRTERPQMTVGRAAVLGLMNRYSVPGYEYRLSLLEVHKLIYFLTEAGEKLNRVEFVKGTYGPYADTLRHVLAKMESHFIIGYGDGQNKPDTPITLKREAAEEAEKFLQHHPATKARFDRVTALIEGFETPYGMELLSTVHWVVKHELSPTACDPESVVLQVHSWSERKAQCLRADHIRLALNRLAAQGWIH